MTADGRPFGLIIDMLSFYNRIVETQTKISKKPTIEIKKEETK